MMPMHLSRQLLAPVAALVLALAASAARADAVDTLREFVRDVKSGRAAFTQTVTSPDGAKKKTSSGRFEFSRPDRFRFAYAKPFEQLIVGDGKQVWLHDVDLNQVSVRPMSAALGATPAALLAGKSLDTDFELSNQPSVNGLDWALAQPKQKDGAFQSLRVGFRGKTLAAVEIVDGFGQRSVLQFDGFETNAALPEDTFRFVAPKGAEVLRQP
ncbi:outer membrane lipoprotein chaperone LolA [Aquincola tertiaricarbonis]|uniref:outer membrane lipoprotein chaperone LolA n=1 Tax=Aquincola tertiaricarbonis TaxID=391953 RepID=UPI000B052C1A|nr:outer membrane lipoprotein chaperone LolA [Aquincola tertiaricarbonis]